MDRKALFMMGIALPGLAGAQGLDPETGAFIDPGLGLGAGNWDWIAAGGGPLFFALFVGVLLAFAFQWIMTCLSAAMGLTAAGAGARRLRKRSYFPEDRYRDEGRFREREEGYEGYRDDRHRPRSGEDFEEKAWEKPLHRVGTGIGLWVLITVSISSFFAAWSAAELIRFGGRVEAILIGLAVWSGFMFASMWMEANVLGSLMGNLVGAVKSGLQAVATPFKSAAGAVASKAGSSAEEIAAKVREEFLAQGGTGGIKEKLKGFTDALPSRALDGETLRAEAENLFEEPEIREAARAAGPFQDKRRFQDIVSGRQDLSHEEQRRLCEVLLEQWNRAALEGPPAGAPIYAGSRQESRSESRGAESGAPMPAAGTGLHRVEASGSTFSSGPYANPGSSRFGSSPAPSRVAGASAFVGRFQSFKEFLQTAEKHELNPIRIEQEVESLVLHPEEGSAGMERNIREMNRSEVTQALRQRRDLTLEEADSIADLIDATRTRMLSHSEIREHRSQEISDRALARIRDWAYGLKRPALDLEAFNRDFTRMLEDPKGTLLGLKDKASETVDRETLIHAFAAKQGVTRQEAERMAEQAERALEASRDKARKIEEETRRRMESLRRESLEQAEATRRLAASAAWWLFAVAVLSGAAAALGGLVGAST